MTLNRLSFEEFTLAAAQSDSNPFAPFVREGRIVYVYALTRDRCSGCEMQKPLFEELAVSVHEKYGDRVQFNTVHVSDAQLFREKLQDFRRMLKFAAYPTYLVLLKTEVGIVEVYRSIEPPMEEIARNIDTALELASR